MSTDPRSATFSGRTVVAAVIGDPVAHSLSPALHNAAYAALGFDGIFVAFAVRHGAAGVALAGARELGLIGLSVTTPLKDAIAHLADRASPTVERLGAANCVALSLGVSVAHSTDGEGFVDDLRLNAGFDPSGERCVVLGAGGAARAIVDALATAGARSVTVVNRSDARARAAAALGGAVGRVGELAECAEARLVVNATSVGLAAGADEVGVAMAAPLGAGQLVVDLVYHPAKTPYLVAAEGAGATVRNGLGMLVHQAARQVTIHTGQTAPIDAMWEAVADHGPRALGGLSSSDAAK